ncbi:hypothetical protein RM572_28315 [Streptomyces sp. DSM 42041]|uniref:Uncharacterized protein n=1 Tax=Streptomyces hazeniae TaxID=3075538 RepID=A0ABU2P091_9ACTN|nr:hypothetical protein [Streptomyces sp. DSM 42041]MDT0382659.1 hypothetical protein [Streptomyces sp. DSM 42041]
MLHITLNGTRELDPATCPMGRTFNGWHPQMSEREVYEVNRGRWVLGARSDRERYALFSSDGIVRAAVAIDSVGSSDGQTSADNDGRRALTGRVLAAGHPVHDAYVGKPTPADVVGNRNAIGYVASEHDTGLCACGCGETVVRRDFASGHDQRAVQTRIAKVGSVVDFLAWFDATWSAQQQEPAA